MKTLFTLLIFFTFNWASASTETCELYVQSDMDGVINKSLNFIVGSKQVSDRLNQKEKALFERQGFKLIPKKFSYTALSLVFLQKNHQFAIYKENGEYTFFRAFKDGQQTFRKESFILNKLRIPSCKYLKSITNKRKLNRYFMRKAQSSISTSWGKTIIALESIERVKSGDLTSTASWNPLLKRYDFLKASIQSSLNKQVNPSLNDKLETIRSQLLVAGMTKYRRDHTTITDFLNGQGGNCITRTMLFSSLIKDLKINIPKSIEIGAETFSDHIQAVILERSVPEVTDLVYLERKHDLKNPIYSFEFLIKNIFQKNKDLIFKTDNFTVPFLNVQDFLFRPENLIEKTPIRFDNVNTSRRIDVLDTSKFTYTTAFGNGKEVPEKVNESYLINQKYSFNKSPSKGNGELTEDFSLLNSSGGSGQSQTRFELGFPYGLDSYYFEFVGDGIQTTTFFNYKRMHEDQEYLDSDIEKYGFKHIKNIFPKDISSTHELHALPFITISNNGNTSTSLFFRNEHPGYVWRVSESDVEAVSKMNLVEKYQFLIKKSILDFKSVVYDLQQSQANLKSSLLSFKDFLSFKTELKQISSLSIFLRKCEFPPSALEFKDFDCLQFLKAHGVNINDIQQVSSNYAFIQQQALEEFFHNPHGFIAFFDSLSTEDQKNIEELLRRLNSDMSYLNSLFELESNGLEAPLHYISEYFLRNKFYSYTQPLENDAADIGNQSMKTLNDNIQLPKVAPVGFCIGKKGLTPYGTLYVDCSNNLKDNTLPIDREIFSIKTSTFIHLANISTRYKKNFNDVDTLFLHHLWRGKYTVELERAGSHLLHGINHYSQRLLPYSWSISKSEALDPIINGQTCDFNINCVTEFNYKRHLEEKAAKYPSWVRHNPEYQELYDSFLNTKHDIFNSNKLVFKFWEPDRGLTLPLEYSVQPDLITMLKSRYSAEKTDEEIKVHLKREFSGFNFSQENNELYFMSRFNKNYGHDSVINKMIIKNRLYITNAVNIRTRDLSRRIYNITYIKSPNFKMHPDLIDKIFKNNTSDNVKLSDFKNKIF